MLNHEVSERGTTRRHTFFCINKERHTQAQKVTDIHKKTVKVFGKTVVGWLITTEEQVIETIIPVQSSFNKIDSMPDKDTE
jgi:hypothetical protein|tara:strand:+ start:61 stop:303 length:243 start_codon:yes stop_codon:yes gene_type:complete